MVDFKKFQNMNEFYQALNRMKLEIKNYMIDGNSLVIVYSFETNSDRNSAGDFINAWFKSDDIKRKTFRDNNYAGNEFYLVIVR